jgi:hypothetical protein
LIAPAFEDAITPLLRLFHWYAGYSATLFTRYWLFFISFILLILPLPASNISFHYWY